LAGRRARRKTRRPTGSCVWTIARRQRRPTRKQAEETIKHGLGDPDSVLFRAEGVSQAASVKHGAFGDRIAGPVSIVCGQYNAGGQTGAYAWFFVAIKHGEVLWADVDEAAAGPGSGYYGCKNAGLAS